MTPNAPAAPEPTKRPTGAAVTAALTPFLGLPLAFVFFALALSAGGQGGGLSFLVLGWREGGWPMYLILAVGGVVALVSAALMYFGVQRGSAAVLANAPLASLLAATGAAGYWMGMNGAIKAIAFVSAADRATILAAALSEALNSSLFGLSAMAGLLVALSLGALFGFAAQSGVARTLMGVTMAVFAALAVVAGVWMMRLHELMSGFRALANVPADQRLPVLEELGSELDRYKLYMLIALGVLGVVLALGAALVRESPRAAVLLPLMGLGGLVGLGAQAFARSGIESAASTLDVPALGLIPLDGLSTDGARWCLNDVGVVDCRDGRFGDAVEVDDLEDEIGTVARRNAEAAVDDRIAAPVPVGVAKSATPAALWTFLDAAKRAGASEVGLQGETEPRPVKVPSEAAIFSSFLSTRLRMVPVGLATKSKRCPTSCDLATVKGDSLVVGAETWTAAPLTAGRASLKDDVLLDGYRSLSPQVLTTLALAAGAHGRRLVILLPDDGDDAEGEEDGDDGEEGEPPAANDDREQLLRVVRRHQPEIRFCYERALTKNPALEGKITVKWVITKTGSVGEVSIEQQTLKDPSVAECLVGRVRTWKFTRPASGQDLTVAFPFTFKPAD